MTPVELVEAFSKMIREAREAKGLTQSQLAEKMGRSPSFIGKLEVLKHNGSLPGQPTIDLLAHHLSLDKGILTKEVERVGVAIECISFSAQYAALKDRADKWGISFLGESDCQISGEVTSLHRELQKLMPHLKGVMSDPVAAKAVASVVRGLEKDGYGKPSRQEEKNIARGSDPVQDLASIIRGARIERDLVQVQLASRLGCSAGYIGRMEKVKPGYGSYVVPSSKFFDRMAHVLEVDPDFLKEVAGRARLVIAQHRASTRAKNKKDSKQE